MICGKCNNVVPDNFTFCPYCGEKVEAAPTPVEELAAVARSSAMPKEEEYSGRYETGDMPAPEIRISKSLSGTKPVPQQQPVQHEAPAAPVAPVVAEPKQQICSCGAVLREGAKFCTSCGKVVEAPAEPEVPAPVIPPMPATPPQQKQNTCPACGTEIREGAKFCNGCGQKFADTAPAAEAPAWPPVQAPVQQPVAAPRQPEQKMELKKCPLCGTVVPADAATCSGCGVAFRVHTAAQPASPKAAPKAKTGKKGSMAPLAIILVAALLIVGVVVAGFLTNWFGLAAPFDTIYNATNKTMRAGSFHVEFEVSVPEMAEAKGSADCIIDIEEHELTALIELETEGQKLTVGVLDGTAVIASPEGSAFTVEIGDMIDPIFDELEDEMSLDEALQKIIEVVVEEGGLEDMVDGDKLFDCFDKTINTTAWLKENAGYSTESDNGAKMHVFTPKLGDLVIAAIEAVEPALEDADDLEDMLDEMKDSKSEANDMADVELAFGIKAGKLVKLTAELEVGGQSAVVEVTFEDVGSAKVDTDEIEDMIDSAKTGAEAVAG